MARPVDQAPPEERPEAILAPLCLQHEGEGLPLVGVQGDCEASGLWCL